MTATGYASHTQSIVVDEVFPHPPETIWKALTSTDLIGRWLGMTPTGFEPEKGRRFTYKTTPKGEWDGVIRCEVLDVVPNERLSYSWQGGHAENVGYGALLDTVATFTLTRVEAGTRLRLMHAGFVRPQNDHAFEVMSKGWQSCMTRIETVAAEHTPSPKKH